MDNFTNWWALSSISVPSQAPVYFTVIAATSISITATWNLPTADFRNGIITGFKLFHKKKDSAESTNMEQINDGATLSKTASGLLKNTEYEFKVLAFTSVGDGPNSSVKIERTNADGEYTIMNFFQAMTYVIYSVADEVWKKDWQQQSSTLLLFFEDVL